MSPLRHCHAWPCDAASRTATVEGLLKDMGKTPSLEVGVEYRSIVGLDASDRSIPWVAGPAKTVNGTGAFSFAVPNLNPEGIYEYRVWAKHPLLTIYGVEKRLPMK